MNSLDFVGGNDAMLGGAGTDHCVAAPSDESGETSSGDRTVPGPNASWGTTERKALPLDESDIREFVERDYERVVAGLTLLAGSQSAAEEAVQEALARIWERGERIESLKAWVTVVSRNLLRSRWRRILAERRARERLAAGLTPQSPPTDDRSEVFEAVRSLPARQRDVIVLHYYLDLSVRDVARTIHASEGAVKNALHHGRRSLAARLDPADPQEANDAHGR